MEAVRDLTQNTIRVRFPIIDPADGKSWLSGVLLSEVVVDTAFWDGNLSEWGFFLSAEKEWDEAVTTGYELTLKLSESLAFADADLSRGIAIRIHSGTTAIETQGISIAHNIVSGLATEIKATTNTTLIDDNIDAIHGKIGIPSDLGSGETLSYNNIDLENGHDNIQASLDGIGGGAGGSLNFAVETDNVLADIKGVPFVGVQTSGTYENLKAEESIYHIITNDASVIDVVYRVNIGSGRTASELSLRGYLSGNGNSATISVYNGSTWDIKGTFDGKVGSTNDIKDLPLLSENTGIGADLGLVYVRIQSSDATVLYLDMELTSAVNIGQTVGYADGAIWYDENADTNINTVPFVDGTADNKVTTWAAVVALNATLKLNRVNIANGSSVTLTDSVVNWELVGEGWTLALNNKSIDGAYFHGACVVTGTGTNGTTRPTFEHCCFGAASIPASEMRQCGFGASGGVLTAESGGQFTLIDCYSGVPGSGVPALDFSGIAFTTEINNRGWKGGCSYTLDSDCILSHEVLVGGGTSIVTGGADCEIRGITRSVNITMSGSENIQFVGTTGPITLSGTTTGTVNLYGISSKIIDTTVTAIVNNETVNSAQINTLATETKATSNTAVLNSHLNTQDVEINKVVAKLPSGLISDLSLATLVDGVTIEYILQLGMSVANGDFDKEVIGNPEELKFRITIYKRTIGQVLSIFEIDEIAGTKRRIQ